MYEGKVPDGGESKYRGFKTEKAWCTQESTRPGQLEESGRERDQYINETGESGKNRILSSWEEETVTEEEQWALKQDTVASWKPREERVSRRKKRCTLLKDDENPVK